MSGGALKLHDVRKLADSRAAFEFDVPLRELPGLPAELGAADAGVHVQVRFGREQGYATADVRLNARLQITCQRCMQPMPLSVQAHSPVLVVDSEQQAEEAPPGWETFLAPDGRLSLETLVAEELLLALPIVPLHAAGETCAALEAEAPGTQTASAENEAQGTVRPFADLRALLEQGGKRPGR
jgi:uncharacterized protein